MDHGAKVSITDFQFVDVGFKAHWSHQITEEFMFETIKEWWNKPSAKERILNAIPSDDWISGFDLTKLADVNVAQTYFITDDLIKEGAITFMWDRTGLHTRGGRKRKMFKRNI